MVDDATDDKFYIGPGNVGIGTTSPTTKLDVNGNVKLGQHMRQVYGNYGAFWRNDGSHYYLLGTNSGDQNGLWNGFRPFRYNFSNGEVAIANTLFANDA